MVMTHALVNFSLSPRLEIWGLPLHGAGGSGLVGLLSHVIRASYVREGHNDVHNYYSDNVCSSTHAWSMLGRVAKVA